jgi:hypothetical protein
MKVKELIKHLQKFNPDLKVGTFSDSKYDHTYTPISEIFVDEGVELAEEFRGKGIKRVENWLLLVGPYQDWRYHTERGQLQSEISKLKAEALACQMKITSLENKQNA